MTDQQHPSRRSVIIDCDPGHDDAIAIMLAHGSPAIDLLAITTVGGNQTLDKVTYNARVVATICGMTGVPVAAGSPVPLVRAQMVAGTIHGDSGLDGPVLPEPTVPLDDRHGVDLIIETVMDRVTARETSPRPPSSTLRSTPRRPRWCSPRPGRSPWSAWT